MARSCSVCVHPDRLPLEGALVAGASYRDVSERYDVSSSALHRHSKGHMPQAVGEAHEIRNRLAGDALLNNVEVLLMKTAEVLAQAEKTGDLRTTLAAVREARATLETLARLRLGVVSDPASVASAGTGESDTPPYWKFIVECVADEFRYWPTAAIRVADRIKALDDDRLMAMIEEAVPESMWGNRDAIVNRNPGEPPWGWMVVKVSDLTSNPDLEP